MDNSVKIAIITATYNRAKLLPNLYNSLKHQNDTEFVWIIVDDGSTDGTEELVGNFIKDSHFTIRYFHKKNGGKHTAINYAFNNNPDIDFFVIIDSDDEADANAISRIKKESLRFYADTNIGTIEFLERYKNGKIIGSDDPKTRKKEMIVNAYSYKAMFHSADSCLGYYKRAVEKYRFPEYEDERYMGLSVLSLKIASTFDTFYSMENIAVVEYQEGGLTALGRKYRLKNPLGMITYCGLKMDERNPVFSSRLKYAIEAQAYAIHSRIGTDILLEKGIDSKVLKKWARPLGRILLLFWIR